MSRQHEPLRLKPRRWSAYESALGSPFVFPERMVATYESYSWQYRPVRGTDYSEIPLFWTPHQAARTLDMTLAEYYSAGYSPARNSANCPMYRPRAVIYSALSDSVGLSVTDPAGDAITSLADELEANGIWAGRAYPYEPDTSTDPGDLSNLGALCQNTFVHVTPPITGYSVAADDVIDGTTYNMQLRELGGSFYEGGDVMYINPLYSFSTSPYIIEYTIGPDVAFGLLSNGRAADVAFLAQVSALHDRCFFYTAAMGDPADGDVDIITGKTRWQYGRDVTLPYLATQLGSSFGYGTNDCSTPPSASDRATMIANIRQAIINHFGL